MTKPPLDVSLTLKKSFELLSNRPLPIFASVAVAQLPIHVMAVATVPMVSPFSERLQARVRENPGAAGEILPMMMQALPAMFVYLGAYLVVATLFYALEVGAVQSVVFDAYREETSTIPRALRRGLSSTPSLLVYGLLKWLVVSVAFGTIFGMGIAVSIPLSREMPVISGLLLVAFSLLAMGVWFVAWSAVSLGTGAIVAERRGPFEAFSRALALARGSHLPIALTWLVAGSVYVVTFCGLWCAGSFVAAPLALAGLPMLNAVMSQAVQLVAATLTGSLVHVIGAVMFGELAGVRPPDAGTTAAEIFR